MVLSLCIYEPFLCYSCIYTCALECDFLFVDIKKCIKIMCTIMSYALTDLHRVTGIG